MAITLGATPDSLVVNLVLDADFVQTLESVDADGEPVDWQVGETVTLVFSDGTEWPAGLTNNIAAWNVDKADVAILHEASYPKAKLVYKAGNLDMVWATGSVAKL